MLIQIPADLTIITLRSGSQTLQQRFTAQYVQQLLTDASAILESRASIKFTRGECSSVTEEMPPGMRADAVDTQGFHFLTSRFRAGRGVRVLFVDRLAQTELGGRAREEKKITIIPYSSDAAGTARKLAHEFGHLLGQAGHINDGVSPSPGNENQWAQMTRNLMYSGSLNPEALLTPTQVSSMRGSQLARQFGGSIGDMFIPEILRNARRM